MPGWHRLLAADDDVSLVDVTDWCSEADALDELLPLLIPSPNFDVTCLIS